MVAKENIGESVPSLFAGVELLDERGGRVGDPGLGDGLAAGEDDHEGLAQLGQAQGEVALGADEVEVRLGGN